MNERDDTVPYSSEVYGDFDQTQVMPAVTDYTAARESVWNTQVGGNHYQKYPIQPTEYIIKNRLNFPEGNVVKYVTRWRDKGGIMDLEKARHYLDLLIEEARRELNGS